MKYEHMEDKTRWYEYGPGKEFETKEEACSELRKYVGKKKTEFYLEGLYRLEEGKEIEYKGEAVRAIIKYKYPTKIFD